MIGRTLKHYRVEELLGAGGMGVVYRARDIRLERPVAMKLLKPELVSDQARRSRFLREARSAAAVSHPAIAQIYDIDDADGNTFIAMEYIDGRTVGRLIREGELDLIGSVEIALQVAEGLARAHEANIIHRDIKADNIMVTRDGHAKLLDFGLAKLLDAGPEEDIPVAGQSPAELSRTLTKEELHTLAGVVLGTLNYMSPEQARGRTLDKRSDIFSLGIVIYEMVTGELPFKGETALDTMHAIAFDEARPVTAVRRNLPPHIHQIVSRCLRKRPEDRYPDAHVLAADLKRLKHELETGTRISLSAGLRIRGWIEQFVSWLPFGAKGIYLLAAVLIATAVFIILKVQWGNVIGGAFIALFIYRAIRNKKRRLLNAFTKKISSLPNVLAVTIRNDEVTVILDKTAPAKSYIRIASLIDAVNAKLFFGKPVTVAIKDDLARSEFQNLLKQPGIVYVSDDLMPGPAAEEP